MVSRRTVFLSDDAPAKGLARKHSTRKEFANRLFKLLNERGWQQAELARRADINRDSVSRYIRAQNLPDMVNLKKMAEAFGVKETDLLPNFDMQAIEDWDEDVAFEMRASTKDPSRSVLVVNHEVPTAMAAKIIGMLTEIERQPVGKKASR